MSELAPALPHGDIQQVFADVFFVTGTMQTMLMGAHWHFSRNMTIVREGSSLTLINTVRLNDAGLAQLDALGTVKNVVKIGALHGLDDAFYKERYGATVWAPAGMPHQNGVVTDKLLAPGGEMPFAGASVFVFEATKLPECIVRIDREGGILVACDALQNWVGPDAFFSEESRKMMTDMGFFQTANIGPVWMKVNEPQAQDFVRLRELSFRHVLCGHGVPLRDTAREAFQARFSQVFSV
nr:hypothetical protein [uncultured Rhodoferax sp.]